MSRRINRVLDGAVQTLYPTRAFLPMHSPTQNQQKTSKAHRVLRAAAEVVTLYMPPFIPTRLIINQRFTSCVIPVFKLP